MLLLGNYRTGRWSWIVTHPKAGAFWGWGGCRWAPQLPFSRMLLWGAVKATPRSGWLQGWATVALPCVKKTGLVLGRVEKVGGWWRMTEASNLVGVLYWYHPSFEWSSMMRIKRWFDIDGEFSYTSVGFYLILVPVIAHILRETILKGKGSGSLLVLFRSPHAKLDGRFTWWPDGQMSLDFL
jgi:hypothetical protein